MDEERKKSSPIWMVVIVLLLASVPLYVLSVGPAAWLWCRGAIIREQLITVYAPLDWLERRNDTFRDVLEWYLSLWAPNGPPPQPAATPAPPTPATKS